MNISEADQSRNIKQWRHSVLHSSHPSDNTEMHPSFYFSVCRRTGTHGFMSDNWNVTTHAVNGAMSDISTGNAKGETTRHVQDQQSEHSQYKNKSLTNNCPCRVGFQRPELRKKDGSDSLFQRLGKSFRVPFAVSRFERARVSVQPTAAVLRMMP